MPIHSTSARQSSDQRIQVWLLQKFATRCSLWALKKAWRPTPVDTCALAGLLPKASTCCPWDPSCSSSHSLQNAPDVTYAPDTLLGHQETCRKCPLQSILVVAEPIVTHHCTGTAAVSSILEAVDQEKRTMLGNPKTGSMCSCSHALVSGSAQVQQHISSTDDTFGQECFAMLLLC